jgi:aryl-alcohol dehydrogenase-like predicted oxidoreductase
MAGVDDRLATLLIVDAERSDVLRARVMAAAEVLRRSPDGLLLRDAGRLAQERAWPTVAELVEEGHVRCAGLVTTRAAVLERCAAWRSADAVLVPGGAGAIDSSVTALIEACRWSGVAVILDGESEDEVVVEAPVAARLTALDPQAR